MRFFESKPRCSHYMFVCNSTMKRIYYVGARNERYGTTWDQCQICGYEYSNGYGFVNSDTAKATRKRVMEENL